ncbi:DUF6247 family protein [Sphaerisporangium aureirubrum]|uniref:DUF6247 family protein n=1 Tax=Sphaerisporangium aureirubrum TaxID=1544736 RepID=A0ABW1NXZ5_9ACTN
MGGESHDLVAGGTPEQIVDSLMGDRSPRNIRACLPAEDQDFFDRDFRQAMAGATEELDLGPVDDLLAYWWHVARMKATGEYQAVLAEGRRVQADIESGEYVPGRPLREVLAERAAELGVKLDL